MTTNTNGETTVPTNPNRYIAVDRWRDPYVDLAAFGTDLANAIGATIQVDEPGRFAIVKIDVDGVRLSLSALYGAKHGRVSIGAYLPDESKLDHHERSKLPRITVDTSRDVATIARDVKRRILEPSAALVAASRDKIAEKENTRAELRRIAAALENTFPGLSAKPRGETDTTAPIYFKHNGAYVSGTLYADGHMTFERVSLRTAEGARRLLATIVDEANQ